jgi:hypothetical protein
VNVWGVLITGVGFLLLYMGIKNKNATDLVTAFRPAAAPTATTPQNTAPPGTTPLTVQPPSGSGSNQIPGLFGGTNVPPGGLFGGL